tara:strand:+ start:519 stop:1229 length:711 start_codon:yes stop_codon:yes gene_type:complete
MGIDLERIDLEQLNLEGPQQWLARSVLLELLLRSDARGQVKVTQAVLASSAGASRRQIRKALEGLEGASLLQRQGSNYQIALTLSAPPTVASNPSPGREDSELTDPPDPSPEEDLRGNLQGYWELAWSPEEPYPVDFFEREIEQLGLETVHQKAAEIYHSGRTLRSPQAYLARVFQKLKIERDTPSSSPLKALQELHRRDDVNPHLPGYANRDRRTTASRPGGGETTALADDFSFK